MEGTLLWRGRFYGGVAFMEGTFVCLFLCLGFEDPSNHWTKRMANTQ